MLTGMILIRKKTPVIPSKHLQIKLTWIFDMQWSLS